MTTGGIIATRGKEGKVSLNCSPVASEQVLGSADSRKPLFKKITVSGMKNLKKGALLRR